MRKPYKIMHDLNWSMHCLLWSEKWDKQTELIVPFLGSSQPEEEGEAGPEMMMRRMGLVEGRPARARCLTFWSLRWEFSPLRVSEKVWGGFHTCNVFWQKGALRSLVSAQHIQKRVVLMIMKESDSPIKCNLFYFGTPSPPPPCPVWQHWQNRKAFKMFVMPLVKYRPWDQKV